MELFGQLGKSNVKSHEWILMVSRPRQTDHGIWQIWNNKEIAFRFRVFAMMFAIVHRWRTGGHTHLRERTIYR